MAKRHSIAKIVEITWHDAASSNRWMTAEEALDSALGTVRTVGRIVKQDAEKVIIVGSVCPGNQNLSEVVAIPAPWVIEIQDLVPRGKVRRLAARPGARSADTGAKT